MARSPNPLSLVNGAVTADARQVDEVGRCDLHGVYRRAIGRHRFDECGNCVLDRRLGRSPAEAAEVAAEQRARQLRTAGLQGRYVRATFESFHATDDVQRRVLHECQAFAAGAPFSPMRTLMLLGPCGTGKTHLLAAIAHHLMSERALRPRLMTPRDVIRALRATWEKDSDETEREVLDDLHQLPVLLLDEVGVSFGTAAEAVQLHDVIDGRYVRELPTVVASNLSASELRKSLGDRMFDRLREGARVLVCDWPSRRSQSSAGEWAQ